MSTVLVVVIVVIVLVLAAAAVVIARRAKERRRIERERLAAEVAEARASRRALDGLEGLGTDRPPAVEIFRNLSTRRRQEPFRRQESALQVAAIGPSRPIFTTQETKTHPRSSS